MVSQNLGHKNRPSAPLYPSRNIRQPDTPAGFCLSRPGTALVMTPEEEGAAWKKEPAYGKTIRL